MIDKNDLYIIDKYSAGEKSDILSLFCSKTIDTREHAYNKQITRDI